ncbi:MAG: DUF4233 domain-containing protein [bacterium]
MPAEPPRHAAASSPEADPTDPTDLVDPSDSRDLADPIDPTAAERAEANEAIESVVQVRRQRADRATRGVLAALLCLEALVVLLLPRAIAQTSTGLDSTKTTILIALAVLLVATGFLLRRPWGIGLGSALQVAVLATAVLESVMLAVAAVFIALWLWVLTMRRDLVGAPGGWRMLVS